MSVLGSWTQLGCSWSGLGHWITCLVFNVEIIPYPRHKLKAGLGTELFWKETINIVFVYPKLHTSQFWQCCQAPFCHAHYGIITLISICNFHGGGGENMEDTYPNSKSLPGIRSLQATSQWLEYFFEQQGLPLTRNQDQIAVSNCFVQLVWMSKCFGEKV